MSSEMYREHREYSILHQTSYCRKLFNKSFKPIHYIRLSNLTRMIDAAGFVNHPCLFDFNVCHCSNLNRTRYIKTHGPRSPQTPKVF